MPDHAYQLEAHGSAKNVRAILADLRAHLRKQGMGDDQCGTVEIAMAEALNNIVEHAYAPKCEGPIWLSAKCATNTLTIELRDKGQPLPNLDLPEMNRPDASGPLESLPEGGFGWFLIHSLTAALSYVRNGNENRLRLSFEINP